MNTDNSPVDFFLTKYSKQYDVSNFDCGEFKLNNYFKSNLIRRDVNLKLCTCYLAISKSSQQVIAFYTITPTSLLKQDVNPKGKLSKVPYESLPFLLIGRFAVDSKYKRKHIGTSLFASIVDNLIKMEEYVSFVGLVVDAKNDNLIDGFYNSLGFKRISPQSKRLILLTPIS